MSEEAKRFGIEEKMSEKKAVYEMYDKTEGMDCKKMLLFLLRKLWLLLLLTLAGSIIGSGIYLFYHVVIVSNRQYQAISKVYLDFAPDETGEVYQAYNGYTWNDLMVTDLILDTTMSYLPSDYTREEVAAATEAQILSDIRLLTIIITTEDPERTEAILDATDRSLVVLGEREKEFIDIEVIKEDEARMLAVDTRLFQAFLLGALIACAVVLLMMTLWYVLDDGIYVAGDLKSVTRLPFIGYIPAREGRGPKSAALAEILDNDRERNVAYLEQKTGKLESYQLGMEEKIGTEEEAGQETYERLRKADGVIIIIPYGKIDREALAYRIEQMAVQECKIAGIVIKDADVRFLRWYYNHL